MVSGVADQQYLARSPLVRVLCLVGEVLERAIIKHKVSVYVYSSQHIVNVTLCCAVLLCVPLLPLLFAKEAATATLLLQVTLQVFSFHCWRRHAASACEHYCLIMSLLMSLSMSMWDYNTEAKRLMLVCPCYCESLCVTMQAVYTHVDQNERTSPNREIQSITSQMASR